MGIKTLFFDTYALFEIIKGNENYKKYTQKIAIVTTKLNLMELYYGLLLKYNKTIADICYDKFVKYVIEIDDITIKEAMLFRKLNKERKLSYIDCIGYMMAKKNDIRFLTGDKEFEGMENVEFVR